MATPNDMPGAEEQPTPEQGEQEQVENTPEPAPEQEQEQAPADDMFSREYVEKLRAENSKYRRRAADAESVKKQLFSALVQVDGRLIDPNDLPYSEELLDNPEELATAISDLLQRKPALGKRHATGDIGAGPRGQSATDEVDLIAEIRKAQGY